jgi:hypothetical protein
MNLILEESDEDSSEEERRKKRGHQIMAAKNKKKNVLKKGICSQIILISSVLVTYGIQVLKYKGTYLSIFLSYKFDFRRK